MTSFVARFGEIVRAHGDRVAIEDGVARVTYAELDRRAREIAGALRARDVGPERVVALSLPKSAAYVEALLGVWYAGGAFTVIDPSLPRARRDLIAGDSRAGVVWDAVAARGAALHPPIETPHDARPEELAYVLFTSGSTGAPKGVLVEHRGLPNVLLAQIAAFALAPGSRVLFHLATSFDASISDLGTALLSGATLLIDADADVARVLRARRVTHADLPPSLLAVLTPKDAPDLQTLIVGGEASDPAVLRRWAETVRVVNVYGPTEATICTSMCVVDATTWDAPLLGDPLPGVTYEVDEGELVIGGVQVARGYTAGADGARFVTRDGARLFRTGDRVRVRADGQLVFAGRVDRQLKVRGRLIAPEEIEACLAAAPELTASAVVLRPVGGDGTRRGLVAFVEARGSGDVDAHALAERVAARLPGWMAPSRYVVGALPRTPAGKVDFATLARAPLAHPRSSGIAPSSSDEALLTAAWERVLGIAPLGITDDLVAFGADSLAAVEVAALAAAGGLQISSVVLALHPTVRAACEAMARSADAMPAQALRELARATTSPTPRRSRVPSSSPRRVLVTGATGHIGRALCDELVAAYAGTMVVRLVRGEPRPSSARVVELRGDLAAPRLGLPSRAWSWLAEEVDAIFHLGADVNLVSPYASLAPANVEGTREVLRLAREGRPKWVHHASTIGVLLSADESPGAPDDETNDLSAAHAVRGGYAQSKWVAEALLRDAMDVPVTLHRFGLVAGAPRDLLDLFVRAARASGCLPDLGDGAALDFVPVGFAARAFSKLAFGAARDGRPATFHVLGPRPVTVRELQRVLHDAGVPIEIVPLAEWTRRAASSAHLPLFGTRRVDWLRTRALLGDTVPDDACCMRAFAAVVQGSLDEVTP